MECFRQFRRFNFREPDTSFIFTDRDVFNTSFSHSFFHFFLPCLHFSFEFLPLILPALYWIPHSSLTVVLTLCLLVLLSYYQLLLVQRHFCFEFCLHLFLPKFYLVLSDFHFCLQFILSSFHFVFNSSLQALICSSIYLLAYCLLVSIDINNL